MPIPLASIAVVLDLTDIDSWEVALSKCEYKLVISYCGHKKALDKNIQGFDLSGYTGRDPTTGLMIRRQQTAILAYPFLQPL
ncbi:MAG: hypothetical protein PHO08_06340 [Methylococcales bacterium]|nr:hypothetical protein [Methylococcales bacterium]MDD5633217.1 hypothetical protein [Methylococcales bacterium]